jgi:hypothetical protein
LNMNFIFMIMAYKANVKRNHPACGSFLTY